MKANNVKPNKVFRYNGKEYMWKTNGSWAQLCYADGSSVSPSDVPRDVFLGFADVELVEGK